MVGRGAPEPKRSWRAGKTLLARQAHRSENPPASAVGSVNVEYCKDRRGYFFDDCVMSGGCDPAPECLGNLRNTLEVISNKWDNPDLLNKTAK